MKLETLPRFEYKTLKIAFLVRVDRGPGPQGNNILSLQSIKRKVDGLPKGLALTGTKFSCKTFTRNIQSNRRQFSIDKN